MPDKFNPELFLKTLPNLPGVYQMSDIKGNVIYVGKAKNLKKRVTSYFMHPERNVKTYALVQQISKIDVTVTANEIEALLLENNLIKQYKPRYNILFKDDKSFPYLVLSKDEFPRLFSYRGAKEPGYEYFGPYPSGMATRETLLFAQKVFCLRTCNNVFFKHRTRPCLLYQIKRCNAPCVGFIGVKEYKEQVNLLTQLLRGRNRAVMDELQKKMRETALNKKYELAAQYRDQISYLQDLQTPQRVSKHGGNSDIIAVAKAGSIYCVHILYVRFNAVIGSQSYFPNAPDFSSEEEVLAAFLVQKYLDSVNNLENGLPQRICVNIYLPEINVLQTVFKLKVVKIITINAASKYKDLMELALTNAQESLQRYLNFNENLQKNFQALQQKLDLPDMPKRIECFDISHSTGEATVAACVVFTPHGPEKKAYRRFNIENIAGGDDYAAMHQALFRHYDYLQKKCPEKIPQILLIDGGVGQLNVAKAVLDTLRIDSIILLAITKDKERRKGVDFISWYKNDEIVSLNCSAPALHLLQQIRDETHRFAITSHRNKRAKKRKTSILENIPGIGRKKSAVALKYFGGLQELKKASIDDLQQVPGITKQLAESIHAYLKN